MYTVSVIYYRRRGGDFIIFDPGWNKTQLDLFLPIIGVMLHQKIKISVKLSC